MASQYQQIDQHRWLEPMRVDHEGGVGGLLSYGLMPNSYFSS